MWFNHQSKNTENDNKWWLQQFEETVFEHYRVIHSLTTLGTNPWAPPQKKRFDFFNFYQSSIVSLNQTNGKLQLPVTFMVPKKSLTTHGMACHTIGQWKIHQYSDIWCILPVKPQTIQFEITPADKNELINHWTKGQTHSAHPADILWPNMLRNMQ